MRWGTDARRFYTVEESECWFFGAIDHCVDELVGWHISKIGDRWAALEPHSGVRINVQKTGSGTYPTSIYPASDCGPCRIF
jgi:hypothetical protein